MKRILICSFAALLAVTTPAAHAISSAQAAENCKVVGNIARLLMERRQAGDSMSSMMGWNARPGADPETLELMNGLVIAAFRWPFAHSEDGKVLSVQQFENKIFADCLDAVMK